MMPTGQISRIITYYTSASEFSSELEKAIIEFFGPNYLIELTGAEIGSLKEGLMNEWLIFDFKLADQRTFLEHWVEENPQQLSDSDMMRYHQLLNTHLYQFFEVVDIHLGQGLNLRDIQTGILYNIVEKQATYQVQKGFILPTRIAQVDGDWYIVGAPSIQIPTRLDPSMSRYLLASHPHPVTPKDTLELIQHQSRTPVSQSKILDRAQVRREMKSLLQHFEINNMVTVSSIERWLNEETDKNGFTWIPGVIYSLVDHNRFSVDKITPLLLALQNLMNVSPRASLGGKSPQDIALSETGRWPARLPEYVSSVIEISGGEWLNYHERALLLMKQGRYTLAVKELKKVFRWLLEHRVTEREIYRVFANMAVSHLAIGEDEIGLSILELALQLNPNYEFAQYTLQQYTKSRGVRKPQPTPTPKTFQSNSLKRHPAQLYFDWLQYLGIRFVTTKLTTTPILTMFPENRADA